MAHFAQIDENNIVVKIIVAEQEFVNKLPDSASYIQTSFNTSFGIHYDPITKDPDDGVALRGNWAELGSTYNAEHDVFIAPKPFDSWVLNTGSWSWESPIGPRPDTDQVYYWDEANTSWNVVGTTFSSADEIPTILDSGSYIQ